MSDKIRGALFNTLGDLSGLTVLDAFAGTGALSFEAISRGAKTALAVESDRLAQRTIADNIALLTLGQQIKLVSASANTWLQATPDEQFDVVLLDPPYDDVQLSLLERLTATVKSDGILVVSWPGDQSVPAFVGFAVIKERAYGDAQLIFYSREA
jgi:16S rRNA (guanine966-N2)-methyltransferase